MTKKALREPQGIVLYHKNVSQFADELRSLVAPSQWLICAQASYPEHRVIEITEPLSSVRLLSLIEVTGAAMFSLTEEFTSPSDYDGVQLNATDRALLTSHQDQPSILSVRWAGRGLFYRFVLHATWQERLSYRDNSVESGERAYAVLVAWLEAEPEFRRLGSKRGPIGRVLLSSPEAISLGSGVLSEESIEAVIQDAHELRLGLREDQYLALEVEMDSLVTQMADEVFVLGSTLALALGDRLIRPGLRKSSVPDYLRELTGGYSPLADFVDRVALLVQAEVERRLVEMVPSERLVELAHWLEEQPELRRRRGNRVFTGRKLLLESTVLTEEDRARGKMFVRQIVEAAVTEVEANNEAAYATLCADMDSCRSQVLTLWNKEALGENPVVRRRQIRGALLALADGYSPHEKLVGALEKELYPQHVAMTA